MDDDSDVVLGNHDDRGSTKERRGAGLYDLLVCSWAIGVLAVPARDVVPVLAQAALLVLWLLLVVVEGTTGASPGKHVTGIEVAREDGRPMTVVTAALRRPWGWLLPLQLVGGRAGSLALLAAIVTLVAMLVSVERSTDRRGFHDRLAGTVVQPGTFSRHRRLLVVVVTMSAALLGLVLAAVLAPAAVA